MFLFYLDGAWKEVRRLGVCGFALHFNYIYNIVLFLSLKQIIWHFSCMINFDNSPKNAPRQKRLEGEEQNYQCSQIISLPQ